MTFQAARRRRPTASPLARALGAACFAGATALSTAFITYGAVVHRFNHDPNAEGRVRRLGGPGVRLNNFATASALAEAVPSLPPSAGAATTSGRRELRRQPPLTVEEERALLVKIEEARSLRGMQNNLAAGENGDVVTAAVWAQEAGLEVEELTRVLREGIDAKQKLVERNMPMVMKLIEQQYRWRLRGGQVSTADLLQEGAYALGLAADRFDPAMPNRFLTYALFLVRDRLDTALASGNMAISVPVAAMKEVYRARRELTAKLGRTPSEAELANFFTNGVAVVGGAPAARGSGLKPAVVNGLGVGEVSDSAPKEVRMQPRVRQRRLDLLAAVQQVASLDRLIKDSEGNGTPLVDTLVGHHEDPLRMPGNGDMSELLPKVLTRQEADLVRMACGLEDLRPLSMAECSQRMSMSVARTKALFQGSLDKLRTAATADNPRLVMYK